MPVSVTKFIRPRRFPIQQSGRTQAVRQAGSMLAIGAQVFCGNDGDSLTQCLITISIFGTQPAVKPMRIYSSRFLT